MKNYRTILFPCVAAFALLLSAYVPAREDTLFPSLKEKSLIDENMFSVDGAYCVDNSINHLVTESNIVVTASQRTIKDTPIESINKSYK